MKARPAAVLLFLAFPSSGCDSQLPTATTSGNTQTMRTSLREGAAPSAMIAFSHPQFANGKTVRRRPLVGAAVYGPGPMIGLLFEHGANLSPPEITQFSFRQNRA